MQKTLDQLAASVSSTNPSASAEINGKTVKAMVIIQCRVTTHRAVQKPAIAWYVNGKRVSKANLFASIN